METYSLCCWLEVSPQPLPQLILSSKNYFSSLVSSAADNPKRRLQTVSKLLHRKSSSPLPTTSPGTLLADYFASFLQAKYSNFLPPATLLHHLRTFSFCYPRWCLSFHSCLKHRNSPDPVQLSNQAISLRSHFHMASQRMFIGTCFHNQQYCLPLSNFRQFHPTLKESVISPLLTKPTLYIYRPISKLSLISKIIERVVKSRHMDQFTQFSPVKHYCRKTAFLHPRSPRQCNRITERIVSLPTRPLCCCWHYWPWHLDDPSLILVQYPWLCSQLVSDICHVVASLSNVKLTCLPGTNPHAVSPRLCSWSTTFRHVHYFSQYPHFVLFPKLSHLRRWHAALSFLPSVKIVSCIVSYLIVSLVRNTQTVNDLAK